MYAIVEIAGFQYKVEQGKKLYVTRLQGNEGDGITFDKVLLTDNGNITIGTPAIKGMTINAKILKHLKGDKVIVFKKKRRKGYQKSNGHRQYLTQIEITTLGDENTEKKKKVVIKETSKKVGENETKSDDLTKVEGIGEKVASLFTEKGIVSFSDLASKPVEELKEILKEKGGTYTAMQPETWPEQAKMAAEGRWEELKKWQNELKGGK